MNSQYGLDYICEQEDAADLLSCTLNTDCLQVRKSMFEIMAAISLYQTNNEDEAIGRKRDGYLKNEMSRFLIFLTKIFSG